MHHQFFARAIAPLLFAFCLPAQITVSSSPQSVTLSSPTPIACGAPGVQVTCTAPPPTITLPIEIFGPANTTSSAAFTLPASSNVSGAKLWLQVHGLRYDSEASVQVNNSVWLPLSTGNVTLQGNAAAFGGIGGGFSTISMLVTLPPGVVAAGTNKVSFRFNGTNGVTSGFRVLGLNVQVNGANLIPPATFVYDDPAKWTAPSTAAADIAAGKALWSSAALTDPAQGASLPIKAHCSDCHTTDGKDLKYFNYSNLSIEQRAAFHGLTAQQGIQLASYIRSLNFPAPGRPWNPPYQPGPGLDSQPVANWAAGAGLGAIVNTDNDILPYLMPNGSTALFSPTAYLNPREIPIMLQLPDWNSWLPIIHPMDAFGATFTNSKLLSDYAEVATEMKSSPVLATAYKTAVANGFWRVGYDGIQFFKAINGSAITTWTPALRQAYYSVGLWGLVRVWDFHQTYGVEGIPSAIFGSKANVRGWFSGAPFYVAPNLQKVPSGPGLANGADIMKVYLSLAWYHLQLVVNDGQGSETAHNPIDFPYVGGFILDLFAREENPPMQGMYFGLEYVIKSFQEVTLTGNSPAMGADGWHPLETSPMGFVNFNNYPLWGSIPLSQQATIVTAYTNYWFAKVSSFPASQLIQGGWANAADDPSKLSYSQTMGGQIWYMLPRLRYIGVPASVTSPISKWAATLWPLGNWALNDQATCNGITGNQVGCSANGVNVF